jgi:hypothetical protein
MTNESEDVDIDALEQEANQLLGQMLQRTDWAGRQEADLRAKAELMEETDEDLEIYGTSDPQRLHEVADLLGAVYAFLRSGEQSMMTIGDDG